MNSKGILAFAQGPAFLKLAVIQLTQLRKFTDIAVAYVVDPGDQELPEYQQLEAMGATLVLAETPGQNRAYDLNAEWKNLGRDMAYELTPFDRTLLVDADYIIQSSAAIDLLDAELPLVCAQWHHCFEQKFLLDNPTIGAHAIDMLWATLVWFDKGAKSQAIFRRWKEVLKFMKWRQEYYKFYSSLVRNDYALSIAVHELEQETLTPVARAPYSQMVIPPWCTYAVEDSDIVVTSTTLDRPAQVVNLRGIDFHALNKTNLLEAYQ